MLSILTRTILDGAEGKDAIFAGSTLSHASFVGARIEGSTFAGATLTDTSFKDAVMQGALFAATPSYDFPAASFNNVDFDNTDLTAADLSGFVLTGKIRYARPPRFGQSVTTRTLLRRSTFSSTFLGKDCSYIDASDAHITVEPSLAVDEFKAVHAILPAMGFANLELNDADFTSAQIKDARFGNCKLKDAKFNSAVLEGADFTKADLMGADFSDANLISAQFTSAWLSSATFHQTLLGSTNFSSAVLAQVNFGAIRSRSLAGVSFSRACLVSADFKDVVSTVAGSLATSFSEACLAGADFGGAQLPDAILTNAQVSAAQGKIRVVHPHRTEEFSYGPTTLLPASTGSRTTCPDGKFGPCDASRLHLKPVPAEWKP
jgi:uncharacterized protein YjbI with pentapeptide repeats